jgi:hypothetical protein
MTNRYDEENGSFSELLLQMSLNKDRNGVADTRNSHNNSPLNKEWGAVIENNQSKLR